MKINPILVDNKYGHGAIKRHPVLRWIHRKRRGLVKSAIPFDWNAGLHRLPAISIKNQYESGSCGGQAGSYLLQVLQGGEGLSAKSVYSPIAYPYGGGTTLGQLETQLGAHGATLESEVPSVLNGDCTETFMEDLSWETSSLLQEALKRAGYVPRSVPTDIDSIAAAIRDYGGVIWEIEGQNNGTWDSPSPFPPVGKLGLWQHFMCSYPSVQLVNGVKTLDFLQSWGNEVGNNGHQYFTEAYINSGHILDVFCLVPDSTLLPIRGNDDPWASVVDFFRELWGLPVQTAGGTIRADL